MLLKKLLLLTTLSFFMNTSYSQERATSYVINYVVHKDESAGTVYISDIYSYSYPAYRGADHYALEMKKAFSTFITQKSLDQEGASHYLYQRPTKEEVVKESIRYLDGLKKQGYKIYPLNFNWQPKE